MAAPLCGTRPSFGLRGRSLRTAASRFGQAGGAIRRRARSRGASIGTGRGRFAAVFPGGDMTSPPVTSREPSVLASRFVPRTDARARSYESENVLLVEEVMNPITRESLWKAPVPSGGPTSDPLGVE